MLETKHLKFQQHNNKMYKNILSFFVLKSSLKILELHKNILKTLKKIIFIIQLKPLIYSYFIKYPF